MELDKRIKDIDTIQTIIKHNSNDIGRKGYFFDEFIKTKDLSKCRYGELIDITTHDDRNDLCFKTGNEEGLVGFYRFFIPESDLKPIEKTYRPYTLTEWINQHEIGDVIHYRSKSEEIEAHVMYMGTYHHKNKGTIVLGVASYTLDCLFEDCEIEMNGEWQPFGVIEDD